MIKLVLDHDDFMVLNKPCGMPMHASENAIIPVAESLFNHKKLWLIHRLDTDTSGCILLAKTKDAASELSKQFAEKAVQKYYIALIDNKPKKKQGTIKGDMQKARNGDWKLSTRQDNPAITQFFSFSIQSDSLSPKLAAESRNFTQEIETHLQSNTTAELLLKNKPDSTPAIRVCLIKPISGKTHQIRVALKSLGAPIIGDKRYKGSVSDRLYLHSYVLQFTYKNKFFNATCLPQMGQLFASHLDTFLSENSDPWTMKWPIHKL
ncbi:MAG: tRNA pseudouridine32 synthase/23S rRNA pseudouridine746 synthase [Glaciecola sp.]|jgi:tRNA pseudouridine32 synthase/23S rRNA pseudouridine746 synthase